MRLSICIFLCLVWIVLVSACSGPSPRGTYPATFHRTSLDRWETTEVPDLGLSLERPSGIQLMGSSRSVLVQLHGVSAHSAFPSDTQYLITISVDVYSNGEWEARFGHIATVDPSVEEQARTNAEARAWLDFKKWSYSLSPSVTMCEYHGERYYRRAVTNDLGVIVEVNAEYIPRVPEMIAEDDAAIRRIMSSVALIGSKRESAGR